MEVFINVALVALGFLMLIKGADFLVDGASAVAKRFGVKEMAIGLTVVAFGTSAPELVVNMISSYHQEYDVVFGNIIGSNIFNLLLILGIAGVVYPLEVKRNTVWKEIPFSIFAFVLFFFFVNDKIFLGKEEDMLTWVDGAFMLMFFFGFIYYVFLNMRETPEKIDVEIKEMPNWKTVLLIFCGMAGLALGGDLVVNNAVSLAEYFDVSKKLIGFTIVACGTSLPELATSAVAAYRRRTDLAVGNVVGSNIFNVLLVLPFSTFMNDLVYDSELNFDIYMMLFASLLLFLAMFSGKKRKLGRIEAFVLLLFFVSYMYYLIVRA